jgi:hypothetical protein
MTKQKLSSGDRVRKFRKELRERGGQEIVVPLEKEAVDQLRKLQRYYEGLSYGDVVTLALNTLFVTKSLIPPESVLKRKGKDKVGKE